MMRSDAAARRLLVSLISLQTLKLNIADDLPACTGELKPFEAYNSVVVSAANLKSPPVHLGFNRSAALEGFFPQVSAQKFECAEAVTEFQAKAVGSPVTFYFGDQTCPLSSVSVYKTEAASTNPEGVGFRMDFDSCSAAVLVGVKKNPTPVSNIVPWMRHICHRVVTTTAPDITKVEVGTEIKFEPLTPLGKCVGTELKSIPITTAADLGDCEVRCRAEALANKVINTSAMCSHLAFNVNGGDDACILYNEVTESEDDVDGGYTCSQMMEVSQESDTVTTAPLSEEELAKLNKIPELSVTWGADTAILEEVVPADETQTCVKPFKYFTLQDSDSKKAMIPVDESQWEEMMGYIPEPKASDCVCQGAMTIDRVAFVSAGSQASLAKAWKAACPDPDAIAKIQKEQEEKDKEKSDEKTKECTTVDTMVSVFTGVSLPLVIWLLIGVVYFITVEIPSARPAEQQQANPFSARTESDFKSGAAEQSKLLPTGQSSIVPNPCSPTVFLIMVAVAVFGSLLMAWFGVEFLGVMLSSLGCTPHFHDLLLVKIAGALATMIAIILALRYMRDEHYDRPPQEQFVVGRIPDANKPDHGVLLDDRYYYHGLVTRMEGGPDGRFRINN